MSQAAAELRCRRCGEVFRGATGDATIVRNAVLLVIAGGVPDSPMVRSLDIHTCGDGGIGAADLIGVGPGEERP